VGEGWALEIETFLGPVKWHRADRPVPFGAQKSPPVRLSNITALLPHPPSHPELIRNQQETVRCIKERSGT
jgi:hypothetical protein